MDRLRGFAIVLVLICHFYAHSDKSGAGFAIHFFGVNIQPILLQLGGVGVGIFFSLSAYLLTLHFIEGRYKNYSEYFLKRLRRIYPAFLGFLILYLLVYKTFGKNDYASDLVDPTFFVTCVLFIQPLLTFSDFNAIDVIPGTWSLYTEIYFYALLPVLIIILKKGRNRTNFFICLFLIALLYRHNFMSENNWALRANLFYYLDFFCAGMVIAYLKLENRIEYLKSTKPWLGWLIISLAITGNLPTIDSYLMMTVGIGILIVSAVSDSARNIKSFKFLSFFAKYSYGIFLNHIAIFWYISLPILNNLRIVNLYLRFLMGSVIALICSILFSWLSYNTIEKYFQNSSFNKLSLGISVLLATCLALGFSI